MQMNRFAFVMVVWSDDFTEAFLKVALPSQLFPGNLVDFARQTDSVYRIYTTTKDAETIRKSEAYERLTALMPVQIAEIHGMSHVGKYKAMTQCHVHFIRSIIDDDRTAIFTDPDSVFADGTFARLLDVSRKGKRLVVIGNIRVARETFIPAFLEQYGKEGMLQPVAARQLIRMAMHHLHPVTRASCCDQTQTTSIFPGALYWPVAEEGILARQFHLHPLMVRPVDRNALPTVSIDSDFMAKVCPDPADAYVVQDSDEVLMLDFSPSSHMSEHIKPGAWNIDEMARWVTVHTDPLLREFVKHKLRFHSCDCSKSKWANAEKSSDVVVESILSLQGRFDAPVPPPTLSKTRYFSPAFVLRKLLQRGTIGFLKLAYTRSFHPFLRRIYGSSIRIDMATHAYSRDAIQERD